MPVSLPLVNDALLVLSAVVFQLLSDSAFEEPFAAFARVDPVVFARRSVATDGAVVFGARQRVVGRVAVALLDPASAATPGHGGPDARRWRPVSPHGLTPKAGAVGVCNDIRKATRAVIHAFSCKSGRRVPILLSFSLMSPSTN